MLLKDREFKIICQPKIGTITFEPKPNEMCFL